MRTSIAKKTIRLPVGKPKRNYSGITIGNLILSTNNPFPMICLEHIIDIRSFNQPNISNATDVHHMLNISSIATFVLW
jgi:hypothetical protein